MRTLAILPIKSFPNAKQRLASDLDPDIRGELAAAMFADVLSALRRARTLAEIVVITGGGPAGELAQAGGARVLQDGELGHNAAAKLGVEAAIRARANRVLLVPGDCPALDPVEVDALLSRPTGTPSALIVPDRHGTGTNALVLAPPDAIEPAFGVDSCERHLRLARGAGVRAEVVEIPSLALDVDTREDLDALERTLVSSPEPAAETRRFLSELSKC